MAVTATATFTGCDDDDLSTNQYVGGIHLNVFGPSPVARGGELRFLGSGLNQVNAITLPGSGKITDINVISSEEIRIIVPQDAEPGYVTLHTATGDITTITPLTFLEPISIETISPLTVRPGETITITGEYLNLIKEVCFPFLTDSVNVMATDFISHSRKEIKVVVPEEAISGLLVISDAKEMPNTIYAEDEINVVLPAVEAPLDLTDAKPGTTVTIEVTDIDLVRKVIMPNGEEIPFTVNGNQLSFTLPADATDGTIVMVPASGVKVAVANIGVVVPTELVVTPATGLRGSDIISIRGLNMDQVATVTFPNVADAVTPASVTATEVKVEMPAMAQTGTIVLNLKSGKTVTTHIETAKPENLAYASNPVAAGAPLKVTGRNLDLVSKISFTGGLEAEPSEVSGPELTVAVPNMAESGPVTFHMANGESVEGPSLAIDAPLTCYVTAFPEGTIISGKIMVLTVANGDKLTDVRLNDSHVQFILSGDQLQVNVPESVDGDAVKLTLVSSNGSIDYQLEIINPNNLEKTIWEGPWSNAGWAGNQDLAWGGYDWSSVKAGKILTVYGSTNGASWGCVSLRHGNGWANLPSPCPSQFDFNETTTSCSLELTAEILQDLIDNGGLVITGDAVTISRITLK